jgi:hypothetical protein
VGSTTITAAGAAPAMAGATIVAVLNAATPTGNAHTAGAVTAPATTKANTEINTRTWAFMTKPPSMIGPLSAG